MPRLPLTGLTGPIDWHQLSGPIDWRRCTGASVAETHAETGDDGVLGALLLAARGGDARHAHDQRRSVGVGSGGAGRSALWEPARSAR